MEIIKQVQAKMKAQAVIESCENCFHYEVAESYVNRYYITFGDLVGKTQLLSELQEVKVKNLGNNG